MNKQSSTIKDIMLSSNDVISNNVPRFESKDNDTSSMMSMMVDWSPSRSKFSRLSNRTRPATTTTTPKKSYSTSFIINMSGSLTKNLDHDDNLREHIMTFGDHIPTSIPNDIKKKNSSEADQSPEIGLLQQRMKTLEARLETKESRIQSLQSLLEETVQSHEEANNQLKKQAAAQLEHFACMSHEIRTPLNCIVGMSSLLIDTKLDLFQEEAVQMITTSGNLLSSIVDDVLDFNKLECSGDLLKVDIQRSNIQHVFDSVVSAIQLKCDDESSRDGIFINTLYSIEVPKYYNTDPKRLSQILFNLLGNAIKFSSPDNNSQHVVDLRVDVVNTISSSEEESSSNKNNQQQDGHQEEDQDRDRNRNRNRKRVLRIKVKDYGIGIDKSDFTKIFEPFKQANNEEHTDIINIGAPTTNHSLNFVSSSFLLATVTTTGLPITSKLVHCLGGTMNVDSVKGEWCEFVVDLPFEEEDDDHSSDDTTTIINNIQRDMEDVITIFVSSKPHPECPVLAAYQRCNLNWRYVPSCEKLKEMMYSDHHISSMDDDCRNSKNFICILNDIDYEPESYRVFGDNIRNNVVLVTFGTKNNVDVSDAHVRGMARVFPSVLLPALANITKQMKHDEGFKNRYQLSSLLSSSSHRRQPPQASSSSSSVTAALPAPPPTSSQPPLPVVHNNNSNNLESSCRSTSVIDDQSDRSFRSYNKCSDPLSESARYYDPNNNDTSYKKLTILIAEDNKVNQKVLTKTLNRLGLTNVDVVDNGLKAVEATTLSKKQYDIIFMDMEMPIMGGTEACRQILSRGNEDSTSMTKKAAAVRPWIAFLTAHATEKHQAEAKAAGGKDFLTKPFSIGKIKSFLKSYMKRRRRANTAQLLHVRQQQSCCFPLRRQLSSPAMNTIPSTHSAKVRGTVHDVDDDDYDDYKDLAADEKTTIAGVLDDEDGHDDRCCNPQTSDNCACMLPGLECVPSETMMMNMTMSNNNNNPTAAAAAATVVAEKPVVVAPPPPAMVLSL